MKLTPISAPRQIHGEGFPEGKVAAPVGSIYTDRLATAGAVRWIKTSGTGNTGWQVEYGDTGWRTLADKNTQPTRISSGEILVRRVNSVVELVIDDVQFIEPVLGSVVPRPLRPENRLRPPLFQFVGAGAEASFQISTAGYMNIYGSIDSPLSGHATYTAPTSWPSTLPGTPA